MSYSRKKTRERPAPAASATMRESQTQTQITMLTTFTLLGLSVFRADSFSHASPSPPNHNVVPRPPNHNVAASACTRPARITCQIAMRARPLNIVIWGEGGARE